MPTSSEFKIIKKLEQKKYSGWPPVYHLTNTDDLGRTSTVTNNGLKSGTTHKDMNLNGMHGLDEYATGIAESVPNDTPTSGRARPLFREAKKQLYSLGFRSLPGENSDAREKIDTVLEYRQGITVKIQKRDKAVKEAVKEFDLEQLDIDTAVLIDIASVDLALLAPTAVCFDATGLDITHSDLKKALDRILFVCPGVKISKIQYQLRQLTDNPLAANRWVIHMDSQDSRNTMAGRSLYFTGVDPIPLRRYDDLVLLELKREKRAQIWKKVLGKL